MALQSIGDFAINIIPEINKKNLMEGVNFLGNLGNATKLLDFGKQVTKGMYNMFDATVQTMGELQRFADSVGVPIEKVDRLRKAFLQAGAGAETANDSIKSIIKSVQGFYYGEGDFEKLGKAGIVPSMFSGDAFKDIEMLANKFSKMTAAQRQYFVDATGMSDDSIKYLQLDANKRKDIMKIVNEIGTMNKKQGQEAIEYLRTLQEISSTWEQIKVNMSSAFLGDVNKALKIIADIMHGDQSQIDVLAMGVAKAAGRGAYNVAEAVAESPFTLAKSAWQGYQELVNPYLMKAQNFITGQSGANTTNTNNIKVEINANGMGTQEAAQKIKETVNSSLKDVYKDQITAQSKTNRVN